jgi:hypothetical protein
MEDESRLPPEVPLLNRNYQPEKHRQGSPGERQSIAREKVIVPFFCVKGLSHPARAPLFAHGNLLLGPVTNPFILMVATILSRGDS